MDWKSLNPILGSQGAQSGFEALSTAAKMTLNTLYPREFEFYMVTLELVNHDDTLVEYFTFPINPESISKSQPYLKQIDRTYGAVVVNKSGKFVPQDITLKGSFGRNFKFVSRDQVLDVSAIQWAPNNPEYSRDYKSGYGCFKIVQRICDSADILDEKGYARKLYFHNPALGESYLVEVINFTGSQSLSTNMIWDYDLRLRVLTEIWSIDKWGKHDAGQRKTYVTQTVNEVAKAGRNLLVNLFR